jgi:hypothetical protein
VRTKVDKICAILTLALLPAAVGCAVSPVAPTLKSGNPGIEDSPSDPVIDTEIEAAVPLILDVQGLPFPDPSQGLLDSDRLAEAKFRLAEYFKNDPSYDPNRIFDETARRITQLCASGRTLVVLIHGFNMSILDTDVAYKCVRLELEHAYPKRKFAYLNVYWNGYLGSPLAIWPQAMCSSKWAGLGLRNLLRRLDPSLPIKVITHSRGASVICAALWDVDLRNTVDADAKYRQAQKQLPPPYLPRLRMGLIAPAMLAMDFDTYFNRGEGQSYIHDRVILGINKNDYALLAGGLSIISGTTLGCSPDLFESIVSPRLNRGAAHAFMVDFSGSVNHDFRDYVLRRAFERSFLPKLLDEDDSLVATSAK